MKGILALRPSPAMVVAFIALCVALAGTASAIPGHNRVKRDDIAPNSVQSSDIRNKAIHSRHLKARSVLRSKIARRAITSSLVAVDGLTGKNILESSLSKVRDADKLDGKDSTAFATATRIVRFTLSSGGTREVLRAGPLTLTATCTVSPTGDRAEVLISTTQDHAAFDAQDTDSDLLVADPATGREFIVASGTTGTPAFARVPDGFALAPDGSEIAGASLYAGVNVLGLTGQCVFGGRVFS